MMLVKPGVSFKGLQPQIILAVMIIHEIFQAKGIRSLMITSCNDSSHMAGSLHYKGLAVDIRTHEINLLNRSAYLEALRVEIKGAIGDEFDVIMEDVSGPNEHLHVEYDPKAPKVGPVKVA